MKLALLVSDDPHHEYLVALLAEHFEVCGELVEPGRAQVARLRARRRYVDWLYRHYHWLRRKLVGHSRYRREFFGARTVGEQTHERVEVEWINSELARETMRRWEPDVAIVCGTNYVQARVLEPAGRSFNIHAGCLPEYKGNHGVFFALAEERYDALGATLHEVSPQLDSGALVEIVRPPIYSDDDDETLYCRADRLVMERLVEILRLIERGSDVPALGQPDGGRVFRHRDRTPKVELREWLRRRLGFQRLPCVHIARIQTTVFEALEPACLADPRVEYEKLEVHDSL